jgi:hypothetical protein
VYHAREAELQARVSRARVRIAHVHGGDRDHAIEVTRAFAADVKALGRRVVADDGEPDAECAAAGAERAT